MKCEICGVSEENTRIINSKKYGCLCRKHYLRKYKNKNIERSVYDLNEYIVYDTYAEIVLYDKNGCECGRAIIDIDDIDKCKMFKWHLKKSKNTSYALSNGNKRVFLHQLVMNYYDSQMDIDHKNRNGLDNRKQNLEIVSHSKNIMNQGITTGIRKMPNGRYRATIGKDYKTIYIGTYNSFNEAYEARKAEEAKFH